MPKETSAPSKDTYTATEEYKTFMPNKGALSETQHKKLLKGEAVDLKGAPEKQVNYLVVNKLIKH
tara:strand:+ start:188 stop:382 length:195 start_codon:yes stop_codon:yes gene_type:complete